ncbi:MAG: universal stress protein [Dissulfuribacterales bacterium]
MAISMILVPIDFSDCSATALSYAIKMAATWSAEIILIHVIDSRETEMIANYIKEPVAKVKERLINQAKQVSRKFLIPYKKQEVIKDTIISYGRPFQEIAIKARELQADMLIMGGYGSMGRGMIDEIFFGSTVEKVIRLLPCPVLCVPIGWSSDDVR